MTGSGKAFGNVGIYGRKSGFFREGVASFFTGDEVSDFVCHRRIIRRRPINEGGHGRRREGMFFFDPVGGSQGADHVEVLLHAYRDAGEVGAGIVCRHGAVADREFFRRNARFVKRKERLPKSVSVLVENGRSEPLQE